MFRRVPGGARLEGWWRRGECARVYGNLRRLYGGGEDEGIAFALGWAALVVGRAQLGVALAHRFGAEQPTRPRDVAENGSECSPLPGAAWRRLEAFGLCELGNGRGALARFDDAVEELPLARWLDDVMGILLACRPSAALARQASQLERRAEDWLIGAGERRGSGGTLEERDERQAEEATAGAWVRLAQLSAAIGDVWAAVGDTASAIAAWQRAHHRLKDVLLADSNAHRCSDARPLWWRLLAAYEHETYAAHVRGQLEKAREACSNALSLYRDPLFIHYQSRLDQERGPAEKELRLALEGACAPFAPQRLNLHYHLAMDPWAGIIAAKGSPCRRL